MSFALYDRFPQVFVKKFNHYTSLDKNLVMIANLSYLTLNVKVMLVSPLNDLFLFLLNLA